MANDHGAGGIDGTGPDLYRLVVEGIEDYAVFALDASRRVLTWNRGAERLLGHSAGEMIGLPADRLFTPEDREAGVPAAEVRQAMECGRAGGDRWHVRKDGSRFWASGVTTRLDEPIGGVRALVKVLRDQTAAKLAEEERARAEAGRQSSELRFRRLIEANVIGVGIAGADGSWVDANDELLRLVGQGRDQLRRGLVRWDRMTSDRDRERDALAIAEADERGACTPYQREFILEDGRRIPVLIGFATVTGIVGYYVCFVMDLGPQKRVEHALREADRRKDEFLAMLAHELRNPLAPIRTGLEVLRHPGTGRELADRALGAMERQLGVLVRLVDDLLDVSRIMQGKIELRVEPTDLRAVIAQAAETSRPLIDDRGHELVVSTPTGPITLEADAVRLAQAISNLLNNAARYTDRPGRIWLSSSAEDGRAVISVRDSGIGIPTDRLAHVFDLFTQIDPGRSREHGGLGIGLTVVRRLVELHGGTVSARSDGPGTGSEFAIALPVSAALARPPGAGPASPGHRPCVPLKILVVDDSEDGADQLGMLLRLDGHEVDVVHSPTEGLAAVSRRPDLVLLDIEMPIMSGYEVAREIRRLLPDRCPILAALTGFGQEEDRCRSRDAGFDYHLVKPIDLDQLSRLLGEVERCRPTAAG